MVMSSAACTALAKRTWPSEGGATVRLNFAVRGHTEWRCLQVRLSGPFALRLAALHCNLMVPGARTGGLLSRCHDRWLPEWQRCTRRLLTPRHVMHAARVQCDA